MCVDKLSDRSYIDVEGQVLWFLHNLQPVKTTAYEQGQNEVSDVKKGTSGVYVPVPDRTSEAPVPIRALEDLTQASTQELTGKKGVHNQGRESQVED